MELIAIIIALIVPISVAIWTVRGSSKDTAKQIAAIKESTTKQVESIKALSKQQIEATIKQVELEIEKNLILAKQAKQEWDGIQHINQSELAYVADYRKDALRSFSEKKPERDYNLYCKFINDLQGIKRDLMDNMKGLE